MKSIDAIYIVVDATQGKIAFISLSPGMAKLFVKAAQLKLPDNLFVIRVIALGMEASEDLRDVDPSVFVYPKGE